MTKTFYPPRPHKRLKKRPFIGQWVHVAGWRQGCVFRVLALDGEMADLETPKTHRKYRVRIDDLRLTRKYE